MDKRLLAQLNDADLLLWRETEREAMAPLDEDAASELHDRIRRARNKYTGQYRRAASARVAETGGRGKARPANARNAARAEVFEEALARVSRRLAVLSRQSAAELRAERLAAARADRTVEPARAAVKEPSIGRGQARVHQKTTGALKRDASTRSAGARRQAKRDAR
ncbi:MAG TPA: hypothetical protein VJU61_07055 [Polyangiaceae bacterium]|nr:hypothetical protein [Polyangiaceae bacterium]